MKNIFPLALLLALIFIGSSSLASVKNPPKKADCLVLVDSSGWFNPHLVTIDTCQNSPTFNKKFAYHGSIWFKLKATHIPYHHDTTHLDTNWTVIDTAYPQARLLFKDMEMKYGHFTLSKVNPTDTIDYFGSQYFILVFDSYVPVERVDSILSSLPNFMEGVLASSLSFPISAGEINTPSLLPTVTINTITHELYYSTTHTRFANVQLYDVLGNLVAESKLESGIARMTVPATSAGIYFVQCGNFAKKIVIVP